MTNIEKVITNNELSHKARLVYIWLTYQEKPVRQKQISEALDLSISVIKKVTLELQKIGLLQRKKEGFFIEEQKFAGDTYQEQSSLVIPRAKFAGDTSLPETAKKHSFGKKQGVVSELSEKQGVVSELSEKKKRKGVPIKKRKISQFQKPIDPLVEELRRVIEEAENDPPERQDQQDQPKENYLRQVEESKFERQRLLNNPPKLPPLMEEEEEEEEEAEELPSFFSAPPDPYSTSTPSTVSLSNLPKEDYVRDPYSLKDKHINHTSKLNNNNINYNKNKNIINNIFINKRDPTTRYEVDGKLLRPEDMTLPQVGEVLKRKLVEAGFSPDEVKDSPPPPTPPSILDRKPPTLEQHFRRKKAAEMENRNKHK